MTDEVGVITGDLTLSTTPGLTVTPPYVSSTPAPRSGTPSPAAPPRPLGRPGGLHKAIVEAVRQGAIRAQ